MIALLALLTFLFAFMILLWAAAYWWTSALLIADTISSSILLGGGMLSSPLERRFLSGMLNPVVGVWHEPAGAI